ncbi:TetR/AcrR family transcriptional regulator [Nonomuraea angiospora]|uniref:AcrR family transcriptional regulator n=1 Tax=Nonomuraea angiospora TaxID=46172 RepID=A0ABR9M5X6_9ACTN|nr:TetR family transcriptional regulator [Nonomuraea angiospora]MBE1588254.1 AcrR family transcriptional regulator [Nonomuraea angiospora]
MDRQHGLASSLRELKQQRAREALVEAAHALFDERGFERVTVTDIAARAEVGRATFFRYFGDKQEVVFADVGELDAAMAEAARIPSGGPIGASMPAALAFVRAVVVSYMLRLTAEPDTYARHERLVDSHPELQARSLIKQRRYAEALRGLLEDRGAEHETAAMAAEIGLAAFYAGRRIAGNDPERLPGAVEAAFDRLT